MKRVQLQGIDTRELLQTLETCIQFLHIIKTRIWLIGITVVIITMIYGHNNFTIKLNIEVIILI